MTTSLSEWDDDAEEFGTWSERPIDGELTWVWMPHCPYHPGFQKPCRACAAALSPAEGEE